MILTWMLYCTLVAALLGLGAAALERALGALGGATRGAWAAAILLSAAFPVALPRLMELRAAPVASGAAGAVGESGAPRIGAPAAPSGPTALEAADLLLLPAWGLASAGLVLAGCALLLVLRVRRRGWRRAVVAGEAVLVSAATGPAVVGFLRGSIVLPEWALGWDEERQRMMVEHEREHLRARDPLLFLLALVCAAAVPWNAALWWQLRRLRLAVEVDCDARVLRRRPDVRAYGLLLLEVGRLASSGRVPVLALTEPPSFLERRIRTMTSRTPERSFRRAVLPAAVCAGALVLAAALPAPRSGVPGRDVTFGIDRQLAADTVPLPAAGVIDVGDATDRPRLANGAQVQRLLASSYPPELRAARVTGMAQVAMVVTATGAVAEARAVEATHPAFADAAVAVMSQARFEPAKRGGRAVAVRLRVPVAFTLDGHAPVPGVPRFVPQAQRAEPAAAGQGIVDVGALDRQPALRNAPEVQRVLQAGYPPALRESGVTGLATVAFVVGTDGATRDVRLVSASREEFGEPALAAVRAMRFTPGELAGRAATARVQIPVMFSLASPANPVPTAPPREP
ncbi:MAG: M56 family metallopeptidase [Longimicrobiaceae bacterium]